METATGRGSGGRGSRWSALKRRLGFKGGLGCCGSSWGLRASSSAAAGWVVPREELLDRGEEPSAGWREADRFAEEDGCDGEIRAAGSPAMNLATALAAERQFRAASATIPGQRERGDDEVGTPLRASLMTLLAEGGGVGGEEGAADVGSGSASAFGVAWWCCVCMGRRKGAAFIPCGHTFCRVCSRELWLNRGACPLCNRTIRDVLDIF